MGRLDAVPVTGEDMNPNQGACGGPEGLLRAVLLPDNAGDGLMEAAARLESARQEQAGEVLLLSGLFGGAGAALLAAWRERTGGPALLVVPDRDEALQLVEDLEVWLGADSVIHLPQQDVLAFDHNSPETSGVGDLLAGLALLRTAEAPLVVTSLPAVRQRVMAPGELDQAVIRLREGQELDMDGLADRLIGMGYRPAGMVAKVGDFARRGGLFDIFTPGLEPLRIEFFDDEVASVRRFDVESQRTTERGEQATILPVSHLRLDEDTVLNCLARVEQEMLAA